MALELRILEVKVITLGSHNFTIGFIRGRRLSVSPCDAITVSDEAHRPSMGSGILQLNFHTTLNVRNIFSYKITSLCYSTIVKEIDKCNQVQENTPLSFKVFKLVFKSLLAY